MRDIILALDRFGDQALLLGRVGENRATRVLIGLKSILSQYPDAIASITVKQPDRAEYPATVKQEGGILTWEITSADIGNNAGSGQAQITIQDADGTIIKTAIACTRVSESLGDATAPAPDPVETWIDKATGTLADVERAGNAAQAVADEVQRRLDDGDFVGPQGPKGEPGEGFTAAAKAMILALFESAAYGSESMQATLESLKAEWDNETATVPVASVSLNKNALTLTEGESETLTATVLPDNATSKAVSWSVSPAGFATVSGGLVTAVKAGACTVTATCGGKSASCNVTVKAAQSGGDTTQDIAGETPVYKLAEATTFTPAKANVIDTGIKMLSSLDPKPAYTILFEVQYNDTIAAKGDTHVLLHCMEEASTWPGFVVQVGGSGVLQVNMYGFGKVLDTRDDLVAHKRRFAVQFYDGKIKGIAYTGNYFTGNKESDYASEITNYTPAVGKSLLLGGYQTSDGVKGRYFDGVLSACLVYDKALTGMQMYNWVMGA